ncbi:hypothetical protein LAZ67_13001870 [Cordylochernes scorpioides]|uniref:Uncharacterized protein n=1 Tax=Cordylochernes scorpioides TaxID=51811 RepID=A0ABY6L4Z6_9ARAC|nr:hypothetical protein LAZ67_13001870 [Cordylochernes scorpioides]
MQRKSKKEATWCTPSKLLSQEVGLLLPPTPVYFLEDSRRFYELLSSVLLLLSLTVLQLESVETIIASKLSRNEYKNTEERS